MELAQISLTLRRFSKGRCNLSVTASTVLDIARTLLNDDVGSLWTDSTLFPKLRQAHRELQAKLKASAAPVMRTIVNDLVVNAGVTSLSAIADLLEPIKLYEKLTTDPATGYVQMTESDPLPIVAPSSSLINWQWTMEQILFNTATTNRHVKMLYWRSLPLPSVNSDAVGFLNAELYLAPRTAALASAAVGEEARHDSLTSAAMMSINEVIIANRGRAQPVQKETKRP